MAAHVPPPVIAMTEKVASLVAVVEKTHIGFQIAHNMGPAAMINTCTKKTARLKPLDESKGLAYFQFSLSATNALGRAYRQKGQMSSGIISLHRSHKSFCSLWSRLESSPQPRVFF
jgi:hypothetical protein